MKNITVMKISILLSLVLASSMTFAAEVSEPLKTPPNDSCAIAIKIGECETWLCDNSIIEICQGKAMELTSEQWNQKVQQLLLPLSR